MADAWPLTPIDHRPRIARVVDRIGDAALLVDDLTDLRWLTGFDTSHGWAVVRDGDVTIGTDGRYGDKAQAETAASGASIVVEHDRAELEKRKSAVVRGATVLADARGMTHRTWVELAARGHELRDHEGLIRDLRMIKDAAEIRRIELAADIADRALAEVEPMLLDGLAELDVRAELEHRMVRFGADDRSYPTIVAAGPENGARPHHGASRRTITEGDTVIIDVGALVDGYHSDMTRSWVVGEASGEQCDTYALVAEAQRAGLDATTAGASSQAVDAACRDVFEAAGRLDEYLHGSGHGVGLDIHEVPFHNRTTDVTLQAGMVVTIEPGLYREGFGGFRIEDLVLVTETGHRVLTHSPKRELSPTCPRSPSTT